MHDTDRSGDKLQAQSLGWEIERTEYPFRNPWMRLRQDEIRVKAGRLTYTYVEAAPAVFIVPVTDSGRIVLIRQYRYTVDQWCIEVPAGGTWDRSAESLHDVARAELREETGGVCQDLRYVTAFYPWSSRSDQIAHVFLAPGVQVGEQELEAAEHIELLILPAREALDMAHQGEIPDGQSALALMLCEGLLRDMGYLA